MEEDAREYRSRKHIGLAGDASFISFIKTKMDLIGVFTTLEFADEAEMTAYVVNPEYDVIDSKPALCFGASSTVTGDKY